MSPGPAGSGWWAAGGGGGGGWRAVGVGGSQLCSYTAARHLHNSTNDWQGRTGSTLAGRGIAPFQNTCSRFSVLFPDYSARIISNELNVPAQRDGRMSVNEHSLFLEHLFFFFRAANPFSTFKSRVFQVCWWHVNVVALLCVFAAISTGGNNM